MTFTILEIGDAGAAAYCGRVFAAGDAHVIRVDQPAGAANADARARALDLYLHAGKERLLLDLDAPMDLDRLHHLASDVDVLVLDESARRCDEIGLLGMLDANPRLHVASITPFGLSGPYRDWRGFQSILLAMGGYSHLIGDPDGAPLSLPGNYAEYQAGQYAYIAAMARLLEEPGSLPASERLIEVSMLETVLSLSQYTTVMWSGRGAVRGRSGFTWTIFSCVGLYPCKDGWLGVNALPQFWDPFALMLGKPELAVDPRFRTNEKRLEHRAELDRLIAEAFSEHTMEELLELGQRVHRVPCGATYDMKRLLSDEHMKARSSFDELVAQDGSRLLSPGLPYHTPGQPRRRVRTAQTSARGNSRRRERSGTTRNVRQGQRGLRGIRVLDLTQVWAGPLATRILADLGADVVKVESPFIRGPAEVAPGLLGLQIEASGEPHHWNKNGMFNKLNRNKRALCINLKIDEGRKLFLDLVREADVVIENFSATAMTRMGVGYDALRAANDEIIYLSMPGYGTYGPQSDFVAYGPSVEPMTGIVSLLGYGEGELRPTNIALPDAAAGVAAAAAIVNALHERRAGAPAGPVDLSMQESMVALLGEYVVQHQLTGEQPGVFGNRNPVAAPQGTYPCRGDDNWIVISCRTENQWKRLRELVGDPGLADDRFSTLAGRRARHDEIDGMLASWTCERDKLELMAVLQEAGVPAGAVMTAPEFMDDPHVIAREYFRTVPGANMGSARYPGLPILRAGMREEKWRAAPRMGEHNGEVLAGWLDMDPAAVEKLEALGALASRPPY